MKYTEMLDVYIDSLYKQLNIATWESMRLAIRQRGGVTDDAHKPYEWPVATFS